MIRHAEAEGNIYRRAHGHYNGQIIGRGHKQIERLRLRLIDEKLDAVYSSDLARACATAAPVCESHGLRLITTPLLREVNIGDWEDVAWGDLEYADPEMSRCFGHDPARWRAKGSESYDSVCERMAGCVAEIAERHSGGSVAVFSHGFAIRALICAISGVASHETDKVSYCDNTAVTLLIYDGGKLTIDFLGDNSHLPNELSTFAHQTWWREQSEWVNENLRYVELNSEGRPEQAGRSCRERESYGSADKEYAAFLADEQVGVIGFSAGGADEGGPDADEGGADEGGPDADEGGAGETDAGEGGPDADGGDAGEGGPRASSAEPRASSAGRINHIFVKSALRRRNYGVQLLGQAVSAFRKLGIEAVRCEVGADAPALGFFLKYEFEIVGRRDSLCLLEKNIRNW